jgi:hypothetical protein
MVKMAACGEPALPARAAAELLDCTVCEFALFGASRVALLIG